MNDKFLYYRDVFLVPKHSSLESRSKADVSVNFLGKTFSLPVVPANMKDVIDINIAKQLCKSNHFYIMHRWFADPNQKWANSSEVLNFIESMNAEGYMTSISIGVGNEWTYLINVIKTNNLKVDFITIDVAHADHENVKDIIKDVKTKLPDTKLIVGNIATSEGCEYLIKLGVDAIKVGIGGGRICTTKNKTGFHVPMFSCCLHCADICDKYNIPFIADGGIEEFGDIAKALTAGATMVMTGGLFAECIDSPAEISHGFKQYRGSTSYEMKGQNRHVEGKTLGLVSNIKYSERLEEIKQALSSAVSYSGGTDLSSFNHVCYIRV